MKKKIEIKIIAQTKTAGTKQMVIKGTIEENDFNEKETAEMLFGLEFGGNAQTKIPLRVHINEDQC